MDPREQLLQTLMQDLQSFEMPQRYTQAQKDKINAGRRGQADIDKGRDEIRENERLYQEAVAKRGQLADRITKLQGEIDSAKRTAGADAENTAQREFQESPTGKALDVGKVAGPIIVGTGGGHLGALLANEIIKSASAGGYNNLKGIAEDVRANPVDFNDPIARGRGAGAVSAAKGFMPPKGAKAIPGALARALAYGLPAGALAYEGLQLRGPAAEGSKSPLERDLYRMGGTAMLAAGGSMAFEGGMRSLFPHIPDHVGRDVATMEGLDQSLKNTDPSAPRPDPQRGPSGGNNPPPPPSAPAAPRPGTVAHMRQQAKDLGLKGYSGMSKATLSEALADAIKQHGGKRTVAKRITDAGGKGGAAIVAPFIGGAMAYDAVSNDAAASGASQEEAEARGAAAGIGAGAGTAALSYGSSKLGRLLAEKAPNTMRAVGRAAGPAGAALSAYDYASQAGGYGNTQPPEMRGTPQGKAAAGVMPLAMRAASDVNSIMTAPSRMRNMVDRELTPRDMPPSETEFAQPGYMGPDAIAAGEASPGITPAIERRINRMVAQGAPPEAIVRFLNEAVR